jgi:hypothetical protein
MEHENPMKALEWCNIVEYFTKRGKPLTREEIKNCKKKIKGYKRNNLRSNVSQKNESSKVISQLFSSQ